MKTLASGQCEPVRLTVRLALVAGLLLLACSAGARGDDRPGGDPDRPPTGPPPPATGFPLYGITAETTPRSMLLLACARLFECQESDTLLDIVRIARRTIDVVLLVPDEAMKEKVAKALADSKVGRERIRIVVVPHDSPWLRDYAPRVVFHRGIGPQLVDFLYAQPDMTINDLRWKDDRFSLAFGRVARVPVLEVPVTLEGGNLLTNGAGLGVTTFAILERNREMGFPPDDVLRTLCCSLGLSQIVMLHALQGEPTRHADIFVTFTGPRTVLVGQIDPREDPTNAALLDRNAETLSRVATPYGPLIVHRLPMPLRDRGKWRSFTNVVYLNGTVLVPSFSDVPARVVDRVHATYRRLLPGWVVLPIECTALADQGGALHCLTTTLPFYFELPAKDDESSGSDRSESPASPGAIPNCLPFPLPPPPVSPPVRQPDRR